MNEAKHWVRTKVDKLLGEFEMTIPNDAEHMKELADELELWVSQLRQEIQYRNDNPWTSQLRQDTLLAPLPKPQPVGDDDGLPDEAFLRKLATM